MNRFYKNIKAILKNKKGMTLIEMITGIMVFTVFTACAMMLLSPMINIFAETKGYSEAATIADNLASRLSSDIQTASEMSVSEDLLEITTADRQKSSYGVNANGYLVNNTVLVFPVEYYNGNKLELKFSRDGDIVQVDIKITGKSDYTHTMYAQPIKKLT